jgi:hypothetical protein
MKMLFRACAFLAAAFCLAASGATAADGPKPADTTWIGQVSDQHCTPEHKALPGDDDRCIIFMANDHQVYTVDNQDAVRPHIGHQVVVKGTLDQELVIGVSYETQGIIHVESVKMLEPMTLSPDDAKQFSTWMKAMQPQVTAVRNVIVAKDKTTLPAESDKLGAQFQQVAEFFKNQSHPSPDAVKFAETASAAAKSIGAADVQVGQVLALRKVTDTCAACHLAHRAGKPGTFQIQP